MYNTGGWKMKCIVNTMIGLVLIGSLVGFTSKTITYDTAPQPQVNKGFTASDVVNSLKNVGLPIGDQLVVENDPDQLLGRPGQYTSKVNFTDTTQKENEKVEIVNGGTVEVFDNNNDAKNRFNQVSKIAASASIYDEYDYVQGKVLLRLSKNLPSNHAMKYQDALKKLAQ
jgi:hypothetical protein